MWQLHMSTDGKEPEFVATFERLRDAVGRIIDIEKYKLGPVEIRGIHLKFFVERDFGEDDEHMGWLEHDGKKGSYSIRRWKH